MKIKNYSPKIPEIIHYGFFKGPFGKFLLATIDNAICSLLFVKDETVTLQELQKDWPAATFVESKKSLTELAKEIFTHPETVKTELILKGTDFQRKVWQALSKIPFGKTTSYQALAEKINHPKAVRAVGTAAGKNPIGFLIPCHRLLPKTGGIGGYAFGSAMKQQLLDWEKATR